jgi:hypothetical protein
MHKYIYYIYFKFNTQLRSSHIDERVKYRQSRAVKMYITRRLAYQLSHFVPGPGYLDSFFDTGKILYKEGRR